ncbi:hypothetical protein [Streptococcus suis]|uniref:RevS (RevS) n=1 Tax=Streptococcus suis TaxID=1307 RepID=A0A116MJ41_STRSU|nr:hypothetical protein [Streptococcus suis]CYV50541.1 RevS (revS) [Streptococcus suis]
MKIIKSIGLAVGTLLLTLLIQFPVYVGITAFQENMLLKLAVMIGLGLAILALLSVIRRGMMKHQVFFKREAECFKNSRYDSTGIYWTNLPEPPLAVFGS